MNALALPCLLSAILSTTLPAAQAPAPPPAAFAGRAFFSAAERRAMEEKMRAPQTPAAIPPAPPPSTPRRFNGALWRKKRIVALWLDGNMVSPESEPAIRLDHGAPATTTAGRRQALLPGQFFPPRDNGNTP
ncbi:MAG: hypothetical protein LBF50_03900 [Azoarcus sp.]|jgi:hypothetical protein|nr:hypothetical protein [Azoarcus sp.]